MLGGAGTPRTAGTNGTTGTTGTAGTGGQWPAAASHQEGEGGGGACMWGGDVVQRGEIAEDGV